MIFLLLIFCCCTSQNNSITDANRIKPYTENQRYWQYKGQPVMLLGANKTDSPYLLPNQEAYYDSLAGLGGNYTRYNVKQRLAPGLIQKFPHKKLPDGKYDLTQWDKDYWDLFEQGLIMTRDRDIIVQLELWDRFDIGCDKYYKDSPWRPVNTVTYTDSGSGLPDVWEGCDRVVHTHPFYYTIPALDNNDLVLSLQKEFAYKVLSISLKYDHILYVITNESTLPLAWSDYWAKYIREKAEAQNKKVEVSEMPWTIADSFPFGWQEPALGDPNKWIDNVVNNPVLYSFCAFQFQPILKAHQEHYDRIVDIRNRVQNKTQVVRPINAIKIFARGDILSGENEPNVQTRFWRPLMAGWAAVSLHRQHLNTSYLGFGENGQKNLSAARKFCDAIIPWNSRPRQDLLFNRESDEAYLLANPGTAYGIYFPTTGSVELNLKDFAGSKFILRWISIETGQFYGESENINATIEVVALTTPSSGSNAGWAAILVIV